MSTTKRRVRAKRVPRILVTGFRPFAGHAANPSQRIVEALAAEEWGGALLLQGVALEVAYASVEAQFNVAVKTFRPTHVLSFGLDYGTDTVKLERLAVNLDDAAIADERGELRRGTRIMSRGPAARWSTLPLEAMYAAVHTVGVPVIYSAHAGTFLCNHVLFHALGRAGKASGGFRVGFIHLPPTPDLLKPEHRGVRSGMEFATQLKAARALVAAVGSL